MLAKDKSIVKKIPLIKKMVKFIDGQLLTLASIHKWQQLYRLKEIKLELGSGAKKGVNGYITVDTVGADIYRDLRHGIPLRNNTVSAIYSSHMLEHIPFKELILFLQECKRVLKPGGTLSVCVPNSRNYLKAYIEKRQFCNIETFYKPAIVDTGSFIDQVNYIAYMDGQHCYLFDEENLVNTLTLAGFHNVHLRIFDNTIDMAERDFESIYATAIN
jgi:predicted SAM-dependent methyltransferase